MKYIVVQKINAKIPILSSEKEYRIKFGRYELALSQFFEALCIYMIYGSLYSVSRFSELLRGIYKDIRPSEIDQFLDVFKTDHSQEYEEFDIKNIPMLACPDEDFIMEMDLFAFPIAFSYQQEKELLERLATIDVNIEYTVRNWWRKYCRLYATHARLKKDVGYEPEELTRVFCHIHGFDIGWLQGYYKKLAPPEIQIEDTKPKWKKSLDLIIGRIKFILLVYAYIMIAVGVIALGSSIDNFIISGIVMTIGFGMICVPLALLFGKR